jgi:zinc protease
MVRAQLGSLEITPAASKGQSTMAIARPEFSSLPGPDSISRRTFGNGMVGLAWQNSSSTSVFVYGWLWTGNVDETPEQAGLASLTASLLARGTERRTFAEIHQEVESLGADFGIYSGSHTTAFTAKCLLEDLDQVLDVLTDCLFHPTFPPEHVEKRLGEIQTALRQREHNTRLMADLGFHKLLYPNHPYGRSTLGYPETVERLGREQVLAFYQSHYGVGKGERRAGVTISGPIPPESALDRLENILGTWRGALHSPPELVAVAPPGEIHTANHPIPGKSQSDIYLGWMGLRGRDPDYISARLANCILGEFGIMGRLGDRVRDQLGLAYYSYSSLHAGLEPGPWVVVAGVAPENVEPAIEAILAEVKAIREETISEEELADNKAYLVGSLPLSLETKERVAYQIAHMEIYGLGLDYLRRYPGEIQAVTVQDIKSVTLKYLDPDRYVLSVAGPQEAEE